MLKKMKLTSFVLFLNLFYIFPASASNSDIQGGLDSKLQVVLFAKSLMFYMNSAPQLEVYIVSKGEIVSELKEVIGKSKIQKVEFGEKLPQKKPDVIYLVETSMVKEVSAYAKNNRILSVTSNPKLVSDGMISLSFGVLKDTPAILLNEKSSNSEHVRWNPAFLTMAKVFK